MKVIRLLTVLFTISIGMMMQACGSSGGSTDTAGALNISAAAFSPAGTDSSIVTFTVTYAPPAGKTAQGVVVNVNIDGVTDSHTFTSGSNSVTYSALRTNGSFLSVSASVNTMTSSTIFFVPTIATPPATGALSVTPASLSLPNTAGVTTTLSISGGTAPYTVRSNIPADVGVIMSTGTTATVTLINAATLPGIPSTAIVTVTDSATPAATKDVIISYLK